MKELKDRPIGVFDSGIGGLTVVRSLREELPTEDMIYFGDTARVPYGNKSRATIRRFSKEIMDFMVVAGVKFVVVACNTASSLGLSYIRGRYDVPVTGVITSGIKAAVACAPNGRIGVIGTRSTVESRAYDRALAGLKLKKARLYSKACPLFVPLVENGHIDDEITYIVAERYLSELEPKGLEALILGCTHYPVIKNVIKSVLADVELVDSSRAVSMEVARALATKRLLSGRERKGRVSCFVSDDVAGFRQRAKIFLEEGISVKKAVI